MNSIFKDWNISTKELSGLVEQNPSLRGIMLGYIAELKFRQLVENHPKVSSTKKPDDHNRLKKNDRVITYKGLEFSVEVKSLQTNSVKKTNNTWQGKAQVDGSDKRLVVLPNKSKINTTLLLKGQFDILAINCFAFNQKWDFVFALNRDLPTSNYKKYTVYQRKHLISSLVAVSWPPKPPFYKDPFALIEKLYQEKI